MDGSLSYLYTSLPLQIPHHSKSIAFRNVIQGYRQLEELCVPDVASHDKSWGSRQHLDHKATLLYGHLHLPSSYLSALYLRRFSASSLLKLSTVSSSQLKNGGTVLALLSHDMGKYSTEYLFSTDGALLGVRGLWNFGPDLAVIEVKTAGGQINEQSPTRLTATPALMSRTVHLSPNGRFSAGCELYYGLLNKSGGISTGLRFTTLPFYSGFPYTMTATLNPLMGNLSSTYAVKAGDALTLCSRFDFNVFSYESGLQAGFELWRRRRKEWEAVEDLLWARQRLAQVRWHEPINLGSSLSLSQKEGSPAFSSEGCDAKDEDEHVAGILKATVSHNSAVSLLWEGRVKELLYSAGVTMDFSRSARQGGIFRGVGIDFAYCS